MCFRRISSSRHFVCPPCRASFKKRDANDDHVNRCPRCRGSLIDAGHDLEVPRRTDTAGWRALTVVLNAGITFHSSCCEGPGWRPRTPREVRERLTAAARSGTPIRKALTTATPADLTVRERPPRRPR
ncbi:zf-TFIIB domain-containing protein [Kitasatospora sp. NPDC057541]|uniref:TFIIB-type zinc ribbon-containing protein n=1 Tax=unclassified Kitasatospora TaxID=2633591 RepID=UPI0036AE96EE